MELIFVTGNENKFNEIKTILSNKAPCINLVRSNLSIIERKFNGVNEVSIAKALDAVKVIKKPLIVEDTAIYLKAFNNFPGINAKHLFHGVGYEGILRLLKDKERDAKFVTSIAYTEPGQQPICFIGECDGYITEKASDVLRFDYDSIFVPENATKPFSEMTVEEKNLVSHRAKALDQFLRWLKGNNLI